MSRERSSTTLSSTNAQQPRVGLGGVRLVVAIGPPRRPLARSVIGFERPIQPILPRNERHARRPCRVPPASPGPFTA
jgi:hypothetical protein